MQARAPEQASSFAHVLTPQLELFGYLPVLGCSWQECEKGGGGYGGNHQNMQPDDADFRAVVSSASPRAW